MHSKMSNEFFQFCIIGNYTNVWKNYLWYQVQGYEIKIYYNFKKKFSNGLAKTIESRTLNFASMPCKKSSCRLSKYDKINLSAIIIYIQLSSIKIRKSQLCINTDMYLIMLCNKTFNKTTAIS